MLNQAVWALYHHFAALFYFIFKLLFFPSVYNFSKILLIIYQSKVGSLRNVSHPIIHRGSRYFCCIVLLSIYFQLGCIVLLCYLVPTAYAFSLFPKGFHGFGC
jgi:hypothetical protein